MESPVLAVGSSPRPLGEDSFHMWGLNRRLEAYLARVKSLEEENGLLRAEIERLRAEPAEPSWRGCCEEGVAALRARLDTAFQEKHRAELARDGLREEAQQVRARCQRARAAQEEARGLLSAGRRALEEEQRTQGWLRDRAARLETELEELLAAHEEERAGLDRERAAGCAWSLENGRAAPAAALQAPEVADYAQRLAGIWQGAVETYTAEVARLESALGQARAELGQVSEGGRQSQLQLQQLKTELAGLKVRKERLEESLARQWQLRQGDAEKLQLAVEALEEEKRGLRTQIGQVLEERQQLLQLKTSLSLEVATYRTLLEAESTRLQLPTRDYKLVTSLWGAKLEAGQSLLRAAPTDRPQDPRPSPLPKPRPAKIRQASLASEVPQGRSPTALQAFPLNGFHEALPEQEALPFMAPQVEAAPLPASRASSLALGPGSSEGPPTVEEDEEEPSPQQAPGPQEDKAASPAGGQEEEEEPRGQPPVSSPPFPTRLVAETLESALREVSGEDPQLDSSPLPTPQAHNGTPLSREEEDGAAAPASPGPEEGTVLQLLRVPLGGAPMVERLGEAREAVAVNGDQEALPEEQWAGGTEVWTGLALPLDIGLLAEERGLFAPESREALVGGTPSHGQTDSGQETRTVEEEEEEEEHAPSLKNSGQPSDLEAPAGLLGKEAPVLFLGGGEDCWEGPEEHQGEAGTELEESDGGLEELDRGSTEALHLSEDEERRELWSPSREDETGALARGGLATDSRPQSPFLGDGQEAFLGKTDPALPVEPPATSAEEARLRDTSLEEVMLGDTCLERDADAEEAILRETLLRDVDTEEAVLRSTSAEEAVLRDFSAEEAILSTAEEPFMTDLRAEEAILRDASAEDAILGDASAEEAILKDLSAEEAILGDASAEDAILGDASAEDAILKDLSAEKAILRDASAEDAILGDASAEDAILKDLSAEEDILRDLSAEEDIMGNASAEDAILKDLSAEEAIMGNASAEDAILKDLSAEKAILRDATVEETPLNDVFGVREAFLRDTSLEEATLRGTCLEKTLLMDARAEEAPLRGTSVDEAPLREGAPVGPEGSIALAAEPRTPGRLEAAEGAGEDVWGLQDGTQDKSLLGGEEVAVKEGASGEEVVGVQGETWASDGVSQPEAAPGLEASEGQRGDPGEGPAGQLPLEQELEEEGEVGANGDVLDEVWVTDTGAPGAGSGEEAGGSLDHGGAEGWQEQESPPRPTGPQPELGSDAGQAEEQPGTAALEDDAAFPCGSPTRPVPCALCEMGSATGAATEGPAEAASQPQDEAPPCPQPPTGAFSVDSLQLWNEDSEDRPQPAGTSPSASCDLEQTAQDPEGGRRIVLEDTLPDHTPLSLYQDQEVPLPAEDGSPELEDWQQDDTGGPQAEEESGQEPAAAAADVPGGSSKAPMLSQAPPRAEEPLQPGDFGEEAAEPGRDDGALQVTELKTPQEEEAAAWLEAEYSQESGELPETESNVEQEPEVREQPPKEADSVAVAGELEQDRVFQAGEPDLVPEGLWDEEDAPLDCWDAGSQEAEGPPKVSPLTSVADLGEIVLDGEMPPEVQNGGTEAEEEEGALPAPESRPTSDRESCGADEATQLGGEAGPGAAGHPKEVMRDSDILEIVQQALEFNQEVIKATRQGLDLEPEGGAHRPPKEEEAPPPSATAPTVEEPPRFPDPSQASSPRAKDPAAPPPSWAASSANGLPLQLDGPAADFSAELPNGLAGGPPGSKEGPVKGVPLTQLCLEEEEDDPSWLEPPAPSPPSSAEAPRPEEGRWEEVAVSRGGLGAKEPLCAGILGTAGLRGKGTDQEALPLAPHCGDAILGLESTQPLQFRPEDGAEPWLAEGN